VYVAARVAVAEREGLPAFVLTAGRPDVPDLELWTPEVWPEVREVARIKLDDWATRMVDAALSELADHVAHLRAMRSP
jgi:hypothetical protein